MPPKIFIIACEPSGDIHGSYLARELRKLDPSCELSGLGGPQMREADVDLLFDMTRISALGFADVVRQYFTYRKIFYQALRAVNQTQPDALVLIDSPAFNLRFAKKIKKKLPVIYYISPQIWAWGKRRIHTIKKTVSKMLAILPFETALYEEAGVPCEFVGHPLLDHLDFSNDRAGLRQKLNILSNQVAIGLLPGSRSSEVRRILPPMLESAGLIQKKFPAAVFFLAHSSNVNSDIYESLVRKYSGLRLRPHKNSIHSLLGAMDFALIASGTATLEAALIRTPFFLLYKASWSTYLLGKCLIRVPYLGMVNLLAGRRVVPEFIQHGISPTTIAHEAELLLRNPGLYQKMKEEFAAVREKLGEKGASARAACAILNSIRQPALPLNSSGR